VTDAVIGEIGSIVIGHFSSFFDASSAISHAMRLGIGSIFGATTTACIRTGAGINGGGTGVTGGAGGVVHREIVSSTPALSVNGPSSCDFHPFGIVSPERRFTIAMRVVPSIKNSPAHAILTIALL